MSVCQLVTSSQPCCVKARSIGEPYFIHGVVPDLPSGRAISSSVCVTVRCPSVSPAKTAEQIQMPFGLWTCMSPSTHTHTRLTAGFSGTTQVSRYQKGKTNLDFTEARDSEWQWHQLGHMQVCTLLQTDNHASTPPLSFLQAGCPSCRPTNSVKALKAKKQ